MKVPELASEVGQLFDHVLVDEYQDTNAQQAAILLGLKPDGAGLTVVGDDAQAIYGFRAANVRNILDFPGQFVPPATVVTPEENYRSTQPILTASNAVIGLARERFTKNLRTRRLAHVKDVLAVLRWAENPTDRVTAFPVVQMLDGIGPKTAGRFLDHIAGRSPSEALASFLPPKSSVNPRSWRDEARRTAMQLYSGPLSMFGAKAEIAMHEKGLPFNLVMVPFDMERLYEPKHPAVERINPKRQVPVLIDGSTEIFDSTQIFEYLEDTAPLPPLWPTSVVDRAVARQLELQADEVYFPHIIRLMGLQSVLGSVAAIAAKDAALGYYSRMENQLTNRGYLAGPYSYADIAFFMAQFFGDRMGAPISSSSTNLLAWRSRVVSRPAVQKVIGPMSDYLTSQGCRVPDWALPGR